MNLELTREGLCMKRSQLLKVRGGNGRAVICHSGAVWVTQEGDRRDIVLVAGESFALDCDGLALVQAFEQSAISIMPPQRRVDMVPRRAMPQRAYAVAHQARAAAGVWL